MITSFRTYLQVGLMTKETEELDYVNSIVDLFSSINEHTARPVALDLWKYYPTETQLLYAAIAQTQHTKKVARILQK